MSDSHIIPPENSAAVSLGLTEAFGVTEVEDICDLTERPGSNRAFRILVRGTAYLLRINTRRGDMERHFTCMRAASDAGLAPHVRYTSIGDRLSITDFVKCVPLSVTDALIRVPAALRVLHALPPFPACSFNTTCTFLLNETPALDGFLRNFEASSILTKRQTAELLDLYRRVAAVYSRLEPNLAPSHNDLFKPDNMLFDGNGLWFVDWEAAFQNDRYADLAVVANMLVTTEAEEAIYLQQYFGKTPDDYQKARFHLMRQLAHMFYAMAFLTLSPSGTPSDATFNVSSCSDYQRRFWAREIGLWDNKARSLYGRVHWEQLLHNIHQPRFDSALQIAAQNPAREGA